MSLFCRPFSQSLLRNNFVFQHDQTCCPSGGFPLTPPGSIVPEHQLSPTSDCRQRQTYRPDCGADVGGQPEGSFCRRRSQACWTRRGVQPLSQAVGHLHAIDVTMIDGDCEILTNPLGSERNQSERARIRSACTACTCQTPSSSSSSLPPWCSSSSS